MDRHLRCCLTLFSIRGVDYLNNTQSLLNKKEVDQIISYEEIKKNTKLDSFFGKKDKKEEKKKED